MQEMWAFPWKTGRQSQQLGDIGEGEFTQYEEGMQVVPQQLWDPRLCAIWLVRELLFHSCIIFLVKPLVFIHFDAV